MNIGLKHQLETFMDSVCDGNKILEEAEEQAEKNVLAEDVFRDKIQEYLNKHLYPTDTEVKTDSKPGSDEDYWLVDLAVKVINNAGKKYIPIEVKFNEESTTEIGDDKDKIKYCISHYRNIEEGYVILLTDKEDSHFEADLKETKYPPYRYAMWHIK